MLNLFVIKNDYMNFGSIRKGLAIVVRGHILNWPWRPRELRRKVRGEVTRKAVCQYLSGYIPYIQSIEEDPSEMETGGRERIFSIWLQGEENAPELVKACFRSMRHHCSQELVVLDENTLWDWIELPEHIMRKRAEGRIRPAHFADICRVELLYRYGGIWLDATDFVTSPIPEEIMKEDFFIYMAGSRLNGWYSYVQNCFFRSRKGNHILKAWRAAIHRFWEKEDRIADYFMHQILFKMVVENNEPAARLFAKMPKIEQDPTHTVWWQHRADPFDASLFEELTGGAFYQKTEFKSKDANEPLKGSFSDVMQNMYRQ